LIILDGAPVGEDTKAKQNSQGHSERYRQLVLK